jgi:hypothetical protein
VTTPSHEDAGSPDPTPGPDGEAQSDESAGTSPSADAAQAPFDPYRYGRPDHPVPPEYAPPGYVPPPEAPPVPSYPGPAQPPPYAGGQQPPPYAGGPPQQQSYPYAPPQYHQYPAPRTGSGKAIAALVLGIMSIVFSFVSVLDLLLIIPAVVLGSLALSEAKRTGTGRAMARSGFICGLIGAVLAIAFTVYVYPKVKDCLDNYKSGSSQYNKCLRDKF